MKDIAKSEVYAGIGFFRSMWFKFRLLFNEAARDSLARARELQELERIREKAEAHLAETKKLEASQPKVVPEVVIKEGSLEEYEKAVFDTYTVEYDPDALDDLYDPDKLDRRIAEETAETNRLLRIGLQK